MAFAAPARAKRSRTWRQVATYSAARLPLSPIDHGRQSPFISGAKRRSTGRRYAATSAAQRSISASWSRARMRRSAYAGCSVPPSQSHGSHEMSGTAPRSLIDRASAVGKSGACSQSANVPLIAGRARSADSLFSSAGKDGTFRPNSVCPCAVAPRAVGARSWPTAVADLAVDELPVIAATRARAIADRTRGIRAAAGISSPSARDGQSRARAVPGPTSVYSERGSQRSFTAPWDQLGEAQAGIHERVDGDEGSERAEPVRSQYLHRKQDPADVSVHRATACGGAASRGTSFQPAARPVAMSISDLT